MENKVEKPRFQLKYKGQFSTFGEIFLVLYYQDLGRYMDDLQAPTFTASV